jgi:hypothetical protein
LWQCLPSCCGRNQEYFENQRCLIFVDNEGTKFSLLEGSLENSTVDLLAGYFAEFETRVN